MYEYIVPSFVFDESPETVALMHDPDVMAGESVKPDSAGSPPFLYPARLLEYRLTPEKTASLRALLAHFRGTLNYQNFTRKKGSHYKDALKDKEYKGRRYVPPTGEAAAGDGGAEAANDGAAAATSEAEVAKAQNAGGGRKGGPKEEAGSEDEREGLNDEEEEALERQLFAARHAAAAAASSSSSSAAGTASLLPGQPGPFFVPSNHNLPASLRPHRPLLTHLRGAANSKGASRDSQTNKVSGQYARFIRYIMDFDVEATYLHPLSGLQVETTAAAASSASSPATVEFVRFRIHGQSFMLNQIRKMIGLVILVARGQLPVEFITEKAFKYDEYAVPTAPSLGLLLQRPVYDAYDARVKDPQPNGTPARTPISDLFLAEPNKSRVDAFRERMIYKQICDTEIETASAVRWCSRLWNNPAVLQQKLEEAAKLAPAITPSASVSVDESTPMAVESTAAAVEPAASTALTS